MCEAYTTKAIRCTHAVSVDGLCGIHIKAKNRNGPNTFAMDQLKLKQKREKLDLLIDFEIQYNSPELTEDQRIVLRHRYATNIERVRQMHRLQLEDLRELHEIEVARTGVNPDREAHERLEQERRNRRMAHNDWIERLRQQAVAQEQALAAQVQNHVEAANRMREGRWPHALHVDTGLGGQRRQLADIARDPQNVHTSEAVKQTKEIIACVRKIPVPEGYRWSMTACSKTPGEIITDCKLTPKAAWMMMSQYAQDTAIYDIEVGIYGKVLDSVWQYVKNSLNKADLCNILSREMEDNIGMCAQGNLTRICNILAGYMDGVGSQESLAERLGRLLPPLMDIEDPMERMHQAYQIMKENNVPHDDWDTWTGPLVDESVEDSIDLPALRRQIIEAV